MWSSDIEKRCLVECKKCKTLQNKCKDSCGRVICMNCGEVMFDPNSIVEFIPLDKNQ